MASSIRRFDTCWHVDDASKKCASDAVNNTPYCVKHCGNDDTEFVAEYGITGSAHMKRSEKYRHIFKLLEEEEIQKLCTKYIEHMESYIPSSKGVITTCWQPTSHMSESVSRTIN